MQRRTKGERRRKFKPDVHFPNSSQPEIKKGVVKGNEVDLQCLPTTDCIIQDVML